MQLHDLALKLYEIGAVKFGSFTLKSGITSPFYIDLRLIPSYPHLLKAVAKHMWEHIEKLDCDLICGVPLGALPIATAISVAHDMPMIYRRKEVKAHGTKKEIEGVYERGNRCVVVEDLITSGTSIVETVEPLQREGLITEDVVLLIDREQGGRENLEKRAITLHAVITISELVDILQSAGKIDNEMKERVLYFINQNKRVEIVT